MLIVNTYIKESPIHGIGLFAAQFIPKGTIIWKFQDKIDQVIDDSQFNQLPKVAKDFILNYAYYNKSAGGHVLCGDDARFTNHSLKPNTISDEIGTRTIKDIQKGEEITENYFTFDELIDNRGFKKEE